MELFVKYLSIKNTENEAARNKELFMCKGVNNNEGVCENQFRSHLVLEIAITWVEPQA